MRIVEVRFRGSTKIYKYLLLNPSNFKIDYTKNLNYMYGADTEYSYTVFLEIVSTYPVEELPSIVSSQIVVIDNNNNILIQRLGAVFKTPEKTPNSELLKEDKAETEVKTKIKSSKHDAGFYRSIYETAFSVINKSRR